MHYEYAVEPAAIGSSWETFRYVIEKFGLDKGRLISRLPKKWEKRVIQAAKEGGLSEVKLASKSKNCALLASCGLPILVEIIMRILLGWRMPSVSMRPRHSTQSFATAIRDLVRRRCFPMTAVTTHRFLARRLAAKYLEQPKKSQMHFTRLQQQLMRSISSIRISI